MNRSAGLWQDPNTFVEFAQPQSETGLYEQIATYQQRGEWFGMMTIMPNPDPVLRKAGITEEAYNDILSDPHLFGVSEIRKAGVASFEWDVDRGKATSSETKTLLAMLQDLPIDTLFRSFLDAELYGYNPHEITWEKVGTFIAPTFIEAKPRRWFSFDFDGNMVFHDAHTPNGRIVRRFNRTPALPGEPIRKFLVPRMMASYENPYGVPLLSKCYWNVFFKRNGKKFWATFTDRFGMPWVIGKYPEFWSKDKDKMDWFAQQLASMIGDGILIHPDGTEVSTSEAGSSSSTDTFQRFVEDSRLENSIVMLGHPGTSSPTPGKLGNDDTAMEVAGWVVGNGRKICVAVMNKLLQWIHEINFDSGARPEFISFEEQDVNTEAADRDSKIYAIGWRPTAEYIMKTYGMEEADFTMDHSQPTPVIVTPGPQPAAPAGAPAVAGELNNANTKDLSGAPANPGADNNAAKTFAEPQPEVDQAIIDLVAGKSLDASAKLIRRLVEPVITFVQGESSYESAIAGLAALYPKMSATQLADKLTSLMFMSDVIGRISVLQETKDAS